MRKAAFIFALVLASIAVAAPPTTAPIQLPDLTSRENISSSIQMLAGIAIVSLAPAILLMMTSFTRIVIVLSLLRQALGTQQLPPNQVLIGLALFMTFIVMGPTFKQVNTDALQPYMEGKIEQKEALDLAQRPIRQFMINQIEAGHNEKDVDLFTDFSH